MSKIEWKEEWSGAWLAKSGLPGVEFSIFENYPGEFECHAHVPGHPMGVGLGTRYDLADAKKKCEKYGDELAAEAGYIRLAPDEVVVKRATAEHAARLSMCYHCDDPDCPCGECEADLTAALAREVGK